MHAERVETIIGGTASAPATVESAGRQDLSGAANARTGQGWAAGEPIYVPKVRKSWAERRRATIGLAILAPFLAAGVAASPAIAPGSWSALGLEALGWSLFVAGASFRFWATLHIGGRKGRQVVAEGPYSMTRNPLYFGTFLMALSAGCFLHSLTAAGGVVLATTAYLRVTLPSEEKRLASKLGPEYREYCRRVPRFWPALALLQMPASIEVDLHCLAIELKRGLRWMWLPLAAAALNAWRSEAGWPQQLGLP